MQADLSLQTVATADWPGIATGFRDLTYEQSLTYTVPAARRIGAEVQFVTLADAAGAPVAAACIRLKRLPGLGRGIAWIAAGPLLLPNGGPRPDAARIHAVLAVLRAHVTGAGHVLRLRLPAIAGHVPAEIAALAAGAGFRPTDRAPVYRSVAVGLDASEEALMAALHGKWRNPLRNALKAGIGIERGPITALSGRFDALYREVQAAKGFRPDIPPEFYYALDGPDFEHEVLIARKDGTDLGAFTVGYAGQSATYLFGATNEAGRRANAGHFLMWQAILRARARGAAQLDLGGIDAEANPSVTRFKLRTGGREIVAPGPYEARPRGPSAGLIDLAERAHRRLKGRR